MTLPQTSLQSLRTLARRFSDTLFDTDFVTPDELNTYINLGIRELHDLLMEAHGQEYFLKTAVIPLVSGQELYELPGDMQGLKRVDYSPSAFPDTALEATIGPDGDFTGGTETTSYDVPVRCPHDAAPIFPYDFDSPYGEETYSTGSREWGRRAQNSTLAYRVLASTKTVVRAGDVEDEGTVTTRVNLIRLNHCASGHLLVWYWPEAPKMVEDADAFPFFNGMEEFPALVAAIMIKSKMESDDSTLGIRLDRVKARIKKAAANRDIDHPESMGDVMGGYNA